MDTGFFERRFSRRGTNCLKWDALETIYGNPEAIPMWVADMDLPILPEITRALQARIGHPVYGYFLDDPGEKAAFRHWMRTRHQWEVEEEAVRWMPSVLTTVRSGVEIFTRPGEKVMIMPPVYPPFWSIPRKMGRELVLCPLLETDEGWRMDLDTAEKLLGEGCRTLILCSPHNPVGRVWTEEELTALVRLFAAYGGRIIADEIHHDIVMPGHRHTSILRIKGAEEITLSAVSATKTFNIAGLQISAAVLPPFIREEFNSLAEKWGFSGGNELAHTAQAAAYRYGAPWLDALLCHLDENRRMLEEALAADFPGVSMSRLEGTYLAWLDFRGTAIPPETLSERAARAGVAAGRGDDFGGPGFLRYNLACTHAQLAASLERLKNIMV
ncbi:MAG: MalY/PatB family protein [Christensenellales bacterium]|jgi:cystathionine beta-lyase